MFIVKEQFNETTFSLDLARDDRRLLRISLEKLLYLFLLESIGGFERSGESAGMGREGVLGDIGGDDDIGDKEDDGHDEGKNDEDEDEAGDSGAEEQEETESECMVSLAGT